MGLDGLTPYYYAGSKSSIVAFSVKEDGVQLSVTTFKPDEDNLAVRDEGIAVVLSWKEFRGLARDAGLICAERGGGDG